MKLSSHKQQSHSLLQNSSHVSPVSSLLIYIYYTIPLFSFFSFSCSHRPAALARTSAANTIPSLYRRFIMAHGDLFARCYVPNRDLLGPGRRSCSSSRISAQLLHSTSSLYTLHLSLSLLLSRFSYVIHKSLVFTIPLPQPSSRQTGSVSKTGRRKIDIGGLEANVYFAISHKSRLHF